MVAGGALRHDTIPASAILLPQIRRRPEMTLVERVQLRRQSEGQTVRLSRFV
jgi:hypothetical protein